MVKEKTASAAVRREFYMQDTGEMKELSFDELDAVNGGQKTFRKEFKQIFCSNCKNANEWYVGEPKPVICEFCGQPLTEVKK